MGQSPHRHPNPHLAAACTRCRSVPQRCAIRDPTLLDGCFASLKCGISRSDLSHVSAGYFYWWVIVSISWGLIASVIAIVLPVWEVRMIPALAHC